MRRIFVCSPLSSPDEEGVRKNIERAWSYCLFVVRKGDIPFAPHGFYTMFMDDRHSGDREQAVTMGIVELNLCDELWYFLAQDEAPSKGMKKEIEHATKHMIPVKRVDVSEVAFWMAENSYKLKPTYPPR